MNSEPEKKASLFAPLSEEYEPTQADAERVFAKLTAAHGAELACEPGSASALQVDAGRTAGTWHGRYALIVGLSCMAFASAGALTWGATPEEPAVVASATLPAAPEREPEPEPRVDMAKAVPSMPVDALPTVAAPAAQSPERTIKTAAVVAPKPVLEPPAPSSHALEREARLLADARGALKGGDGSGALALLDEHARVFPHGWLANERAAERVVVLCSLGRRSEAIREGAAFLAGRPKNPLTRRVEMSCAGQPVMENEE